MKILITAGPTREAIDPVRFLSNRSSGRMGYAIADAAARDGHDVLLVSGPVALAPPAGVERITVESAQQMFDVVAARINAFDAVVMTAAVADYRPATVAGQKIKKHAGRMVLELERTPDILGSARSVFGFRGVLVGFAAETSDVSAHAREKLHSKGCDLMVANDVSSPGIGFDSDENAVTLFHRSGHVEEIPRTGKAAIGARLMQVIAACCSTQA